MNSRTMLWTGGLGDFLHYVTFIDAAIELESLETLWLESSDPERIRTLVALLLPEISVGFVPAAMHWTRATPLLNPNSKQDRLARPAYEFVSAQTVGVVTDWMLPSDCGELPRSTHRLSRLVPDTVTDTRHECIVSLRDKGAGWWPSVDALRALYALGIDPTGIGSPEETSPYRGVLSLAKVGDLREALSVALGSGLYVGTDTGLATARELLGYANIYCVTRSWVSNWMKPYGYWPVSHDKPSGRFCCSVIELERALESFGFRG